MSKVKLNKDALLEYITSEGLSERQFAERIGVSPATISRILNDERNVGGEFIAKLLRVVGEKRFYEFFFLT